MIVLMKIFQDLVLPVRLVCKALLIAATLASSLSVSASDWPMWRADATRRGSTSAQLPDKLYLQWTLELPKPETAWPADQEKLQFDRLYEPVLAGKRLFVGSMVSDKITAFDTDSGKELWRFYTDGPVRFSPPSGRTGSSPSAMMGTCTAWTPRMVRWYGNFAAAPVKDESSATTGW